jgi:hypothetical protein
MRPVCLVIPLGLPEHDYLTIQLVKCIPRRNL